jgi:DNA-directed RNA polymerase subunit D
MKIQVDELEPKKAVLTIQDAEIFIVNTLRRIMISEVPKLAIDDVVIYDNTSALFDEIITHRLGLVPLPTDLDLLTFRDECSCKGKGCPNCTVRYTLSKEGGGMVYSGDLQPEEKSWAITEKSIPLVELFNDQRLILEVEAVLGKGKDHAKWQAVQAPGYRFIPRITFDPKRKSDVEDFVSELPEGLVLVKNDILDLQDVKKLPVFESYIDQENIDFITIEKDLHHIQFHFETDGALSADNALLKSIELFEEKLDDFEKHLKKL